MPLISTVDINPVMSFWIEWIAMNLVLTSANHVLLKTHCSVFRLRLFWWLVSSVQSKQISTICIWYTLERQYITFTTSLVNSYSTVSLSHGRYHPKPHPRGRVMTEASFMSSKYNPCLPLLTHWGRVVHRYVRKLMACRQDGAKPLSESTLEYV